MEKADCLNLKEGDEVVVVTDTGEYSGKLHSVSSHTVTMNNVVYLKNGVSLPGLKAFLMEKIISVKLKRAKAAPESQRRNSTDVKKLSDQLEETSIKGEELEGISELWEAFQKTKQRHFLVLEQFDERFHDCIMRLEELDEICMEFFMGPQRKEILWIAVDVDVECTLLFNVSMLADGLFRKGFKSLLESQDVMKIMFQPACASNLLRTKHNIQPTNVFDLCTYDEVTSTVRDTYNTSRRHRPSRAPLDGLVGYLERYAIDAGPLKLVEAYLSKQPDLLTFYKSTGEDDKAANKSNRGNGNSRHYNSNNNNRTYNNNNNNNSKFYNKNNNCQEYSNNKVYNNNINNSNNNSQQNLLNQTLFSYMTLHTCLLSRLNSSITHSLQRIVVNASEDTL